MATGRDALDAGETDVVLLDLRLPDIDGFTVCRELRARSDVPIIVVSARGEEVDRVVGLELGADDYIVKPYGLRELVARIRAVTRRRERSYAHEMCCARAARGRRACASRLLRRSGAAADREGVRPARVARVRSRLRRQPRDDPPPRLGHDVVRRPEDHRRARRVASQEGRRPGCDRDGPWHRLPIARMSRRLLLGYLSLTALVLLVLEVPLAITYARNERSSLSSKVERDAVAVASVADDVLEQSRPRIEPLRAFVEDYAARTGGRVVIVNDRGVALVDTEPPQAGTRSFASRPEIRAALVGAGRERRSDLAAARNRSPLRRRARRLERPCHGRRPHHVSDVGCRRTRSTVPADPRSGSQSSCWRQRRPSGSRSLGSSRDRWATSRGRQPPLRRAT